MRLSDAILLGRHTIARPKAGMINGCAITMGLNSAGKKLLGCYMEGFIEKAENTPGNDYYQFIETWPWLKMAYLACPYCGCGLAKSMVVHHVFDRHVMDKFNNIQITIEQMCDWIRSIEPDEPAQETSEISESEWQKTAISDGLTTQKTSG